MYVCTMMCNDIMTNVYNTIEVLLCIWYWFNIIIILCIKCIILLWYDILSKY